MMKEKAGGGGGRRKRRNRFRGKGAYVDVGKG